MNWAWRIDNLTSLETVLVWAPTGQKATELYLSDLDRSQYDPDENPDENLLVQLADEADLHNYQFVNSN